jgi:hypothetical protein
MDGRARRIGWSGLLSCWVEQSSCAQIVSYRCAKDDDFHLPAALSALLELSCDRPSTPPPAVRHATTDIHVYTYMHAAHMFYTYVSPRARARSCVCVLYVWRA